MTTLQTCERKRAALQSACKYRCTVFPCAKQGMCVDAAHAEGAAPGDGSLAANQARRLSVHGMRRLPIMKRLRDKRIHLSEVGDRRLLLREQGVQGEQESDKPGGALAVADGGLARQKRRTSSSFVRLLNCTHLDRIPEGCSRAVRGKRDDVRSCQAAPGASRREQAALCWTVGRG